MNRIARHRLFSLVLLLAIPGLAAAVMRVPAEGETVISADELPDVIRNALKGVTIDEVETNDASSVYEIEVTGRGVEIELRLDSSGRLLGIEIEDEDDGEDDENEDEYTGKDGDNDDEESADVVDIKSIPPAARTALRKFAGGHDLERIEREEKDGHVLFEALWKVGDTEHEATVTDAGVLVELEESATADVVPEDVRKLSSRHFKDSRNLRFERKLIAAWEIEGTVNGQDRELLVTSTGALIEFEHDDDNE